MNFNIKVEDYINKSVSGQKEILLELRNLIHNCSKGVTEDIKWGFPVFSLKKNFCYMKSNKNHVTLGFYNIKNLIDNEKLLQGEGNTLRHIKIKKLDEKLVKIINDWLKQTGI